MVAAGVPLLILIATGCVTALNSSHSALFQRESCRYHIDFVDGAIVNSGFFYFNCISRLMVKVLMCRLVCVGYNFAPAYNFLFKEAKKTKERLELNGTHKLLVCDDDVNLLGENINIIKKNAEVLLDASKDVSQSKRRGS
jgi:hypothetical protein